MLFCLSMTAVAEGQSNQTTITIDDPYVRVVPPGQKNTGVFMTLNNISSNDLSLIDAKSDASAIVELHTHIREDGMMKMRRIEKIDIPQKGKTELKPGGLHVMLIDLKQEIVEGEPVEILLEFSNGETKSVKAVGRKLKMKMGH